MRAVINAILYIVVSGSQWRMLPREYPAWQSVYTYFRHTFAVRYLVLGNDPFSLQELLGHEDMTTVKNYMHMNDETIQSQKRKYSPHACRAPRRIADGDFRRRSGGGSRAIKHELEVSLR
jgi:hypothetical protein